MKHSLRKQINKMCKSCIYDPHGGGGTWRQQVEACTSYKCPLYVVRPVSEGAELAANDTETREITV